MKKRLLVGLIILGTICCKAQHIILVENAYKYKGTEGGLLGDHDYVYVKDVNNILPKFVGIWKGTYQTKSFEFRIVKNTRDNGELKKDALYMRYKITDSNGNVIEDVLSLPNDDPYVMQNGYVSETGSYVFSYIGRDMACGQNGWVFAGLYGVDNKNMQLFLAVEGENYPECTTGTAEQILPMEQMELIKQ